MEIRKDEITPVRLPGIEKVFMVSAKYDRIDYFREYGAFLLKVLEDTGGMDMAFIPAQMALVIAKHTGIPIVPREFIYETELDAYCKTQALDIDDEIEDLDQE
jgi:hypothetical protein